MILQKFVNFLKLDRPVHYYLFLIVVVISLTYINNLFYYQSVKSKEDKNIRNYIQDVSRYSSDCVKLTNGNIEKCTTYTKEFAKHSSDYYGHRVVISGEEVIDNRKYPEKRKSNTKISELPSIGTSIEVTRNSIPVIWKSVVKSATLSIFDIVEKIQKGDSSEKIKDFIWNTLRWRSAPFVSFFALIFDRALYFRVLFKSSKFNFKSPLTSRSAIFESIKESIFALISFLATK
jgi:hypothetical protein